MDDSSTGSTRSTSRGREPMMSTGRGGAGNIRATSQSRTRTVDDGVASSVERGRTIAHPLPDHVTHSGRGGAGNVRSPSRDPYQAREAALKEDAYEAEVVRARREAEAGMPRTSGRGGAGNVSNSRSRSRSRGPAAAAAAGGGGGGTAEREPSKSGGILAGRGGFGNQFHPGDAEETARLRQLDEEDERVRSDYELRHGANTVLHSTGVGGAGNFQPGPGIYETDANCSQRTMVHPPAAPSASAGHMGGRGGAGNYYPRQQEESGPSPSRGRSDPVHHPQQAKAGPIEGLKNMVRGISRSRSGERANA